MTPSELAAALAANPDLSVTDDGSGRAARQTPQQIRAAYQLTPALPVPSEHDEQCALFAWADANEAAHPELAMLFAVPNGGYRPVAVAVRMKAEGQKAGVPDILLDVPRGRFHGLRIELKRADRSNHATPEQKRWIARLREYGYMAVVCYGAGEAKQVILAYLAQEVQP